MATVKYGAMSKQTILMSPDYGDSVFWHEEDEVLSCCGGVSCLFIGDNEIDLKSVVELEAWYNDWDIETLSHPNNWTNEQWKEWWLRGLNLAREIKKLLPDYINFQYFTLTDKVWIFSPLDSNDGGIFDYGDPMII